MTVCPTSVTGTSLVSIIFVDATDELRNFVVMELISLAFSQLPVLLLLLLMVLLFCRSCGEVASAVP